MKNIHITSAIAALATTSIIGMVGIQPAMAQPGQEDSYVRSSVTYTVTNAYSVTSKGSSEPKTTVTVKYKNGEDTDLYTETDKYLNLYGEEFAAHKTLPSRMVMVGTTSRPIQVVQYRGQNLAYGHDQVSDFRVETAMGHGTLGGLNWTNLAQPAADYSAGIAPKGVRLRVKTTSTCTVSYPLNRAEVCSKRTESVSVKNVSGRKAKLAFESKIGQAWVEEGSPTAELRTLKKTLRSGKTWNIDVMNYYGGGDFHYQDQSWPMYDDNSFTLLAGKSTVLHKYGYGAADSSPWWWGVYSNELETQENM